MVRDPLIGDLTHFAAERQRRFDAATAPSERKEQGHFGTPAAIAEFMAGMFSEVPQGDIRILDPGAGVGTLSAALCERVRRQRAPRRLEFELWESDPRLLPYIRETMEHCREALAESGHRLNYTICIDDFVLANAQKSLFKDGPAGSYDLAILNPPYYKVRKESPHSQAMEHVVHGQPNIYSFFMAVAADLLVPGGQMVAITPRSYFNGSYFTKFRKWFFDRMTARQIHVFESRKEAFHGDDVLQENVVMLARKGESPKEIVLTTSFGRDLEHVQRCSVAYDKIIDNSNGDRVVRVTTNDLEHDIIDAMDSLPQRFRDLGFEISTGPVVTFRSRQLLRNERSTDTAPLLWMHNIRPFVTQFPPKNGKPMHIEVTKRSLRLLVPAKRYVLLKRFTSKEEKRRLVAGIMEPSDSYSEWVGLENHLNYVYRGGSELTKVEAFGLAAFFNSALVDRYFRSVSGNTQVNATEIRVMPVPDERVLARIGEQVENAIDRGLFEIERIVGRALRLPQHMVEQLCEAAQ